MCRSTRLDGRCYGVLCRGEFGTNAAMYAVSRARIVVCSVVPGDEELRAIACMHVRARKKCHSPPAHLSFDALGFLFLQLSLKGLQFLFERSDFRPVFFKA